MGVSKSLKAHPTMNNNVRRIHPWNSLHDVKKAGCSWEPSFFSNCYCLHNLRKGPWELPKPQDLPETFNFYFVYFLSLEILLGCFCSETIAVQKPILGECLILWPFFRPHIWDISCAYVHKHKSLWLSPLNASVGHFVELSFWTFRRKPELPYNIFKCSLFFMSYFL